MRHHAAFERPQRCPLARQTGGDPGRDPVRATGVSTMLLRPFRRHIPTNGTGAKQVFADFPFLYPTHPKIRGFFQEVLLKLPRRIVSLFLTLVDMSWHMFAAHALLAVVTIVTYLVGMDTGINVVLQGASTPLVLHSSIRRFWLYL